LFTLVILLAYLASDYFSCQQLSTMQKSAELDARAWVSVTDIRLVTLEANKPAYVETVLLNTGKTVTRDGIVMGSIYMPTEELKDFRPYKNRAPMPLPVLFPSATNFIPFSTDVSITEDEVNEILAGTRFLYVWADITYGDVFERKTHHTGFCGRYVPNTKRFEHCTFYKDYAD
jgi:hypothetical protein